MGNSERDDRVLKDKGMVLGFSNAPLSSSISFDFRNLIFFPPWVQVDVVIVDGWEASTSLHVFARRHGFNVTVNITPS